MSEFMVTREWAEIMLPAVRGTRIEYEEGRHSASNCRLCSEARVCFDQEGLSTATGVLCSRCPWMIFDKKICHLNGWDKDSFPTRIERLNKWEEKLLTIIDKEEPMKKLVLKEEQLEGDMLEIDPKDLLPLRGDGFWIEDGSRPNAQVCVRSNGPFASRGIYLSRFVDWIIGKDSEGETVLLPLRKESK